MSSASLIYGQPAVPAGPAVLAKGFRPFFLAAAAFAVLAVPLWVIELFTAFGVAGYFGAAMFWHAHEMVFGFTMAVVAGFLLTAVSNWTSRNTATGALLMALVLLWLAGRIVVLIASLLPPWLPAVVDVAFLPALAVILARPIIASKNWQNLGFIAMLAVLGFSNAATHFGAQGILPGAVRTANLLAIDVITLMMIIITGRVVPMFTRNATRIETIRSSRTLDRAAILGMLVVVVAGIARVPAWFINAAALVTGIVTLARMHSWGTRHTFGQPLLWILHVGHAWIGVGLLLRASAALFGAIDSSVALHAVTAGAIGTLTLGMMTRVGLGHTGRMLAVSRGMTAAFGAVTVAALVRVIGPLLGSGAHRPAIVLSAVLWTAAFALYLYCHAPILWTRRVDQRPG